MVADTRNNNNNNNNGGGSSSGPATSTSSDGCPEYPLASDLPMMCGPSNGNKRCPAGMCCSKFGYCGGAGYVARGLLATRAPAHLYGRGMEEDLERWEYERHLVAERSWCWGARRIKRDGRMEKLEFAFQLEDAKKPRLARRAAKRNCARHTLEERTSFCARNNYCCTTSICKRMALDERTNACNKRNNNGGGGGGCCPLPPCPPTPPAAYCGEGCQPNFGKCASATPTCSAGPKPTTTTHTGGGETTQSGIATAQTFASDHTSTITVEMTTETPTASLTDALPTNTFSTFTPVSNNIIGAMIGVVDGSTPKSYSLNTTHDNVNANENVLQILAGNNPTYKRVSFCAATDAGWETANGNMVMQRRLATRQLEAIDQILLYNTFPLSIDPRTLPPKVLVPTLLVGPTSLARVNPQYIVLIVSNDGQSSTVFPTYGTGNTSVIDTIYTDLGFVFVTNDLIEPPSVPTITMGEAGLSEWLALEENTTVGGGAVKWAVQTDSYGLPNEKGLTMWVFGRAAGEWAAKQRLTTRYRYRIVSCR